MVATILLYILCLIIIGYPSWLMHVTFCMKTHTVFIVKIVV